MKIIPKFIALLTVLTLSIINFSIDYEIKPLNIKVDVEMNQAKASNEVPDFVMKTETCWTNGESIQICRYSPGDSCSVSGQDTCSSDPGSSG